MFEEKVKRRDYERDREKLLKEADLLREALKRQQDALSLYKAKLNEKTAQLRVAYDALDKRLSVLEGDKGEEREDMEALVAARLEKRWDEGLQALLNWNPLTGRKEADA